MTMSENVQYDPLLPFVAVQHCVEIGSCLMLLAVMWLARRKDPASTSGTGASFTSPSLG